MEPAFDPQQLPPAFGLANAGAICHFNALLQGLASCPGFISRAVASIKYMAQTETGRVLYSFARAVEIATNTPGYVVDSSHSSRILSAMVRDLHARRPGFNFGAGMECASEGLTFLVDMVEPPSGCAQADSTGQTAWGDAAASEGQKSNPIASLFMMRVIDRVWCENCHKLGRRGADVPATQKPGVVSYRADVQYCHNVNVNDPQVNTPAAFAEGLLSQYSAVEDYICEECTKHGQNTGRVFRSYRMACAPLILPVVFNQYACHAQYYYPSEFRLPSDHNTSIVYRAVAQLEHSGTAAGGHYWARAMRKDGAALAHYVMNDLSVTKSLCALEPNPAVYIVMYHFSHEERA